MYESLKIAFWPGVVALLVAFFVTPWVIELARRLGLIDDPKVNKHEKVIHTSAIPRAGGIALFLAFLVASLLFLPLDKHLVGIVLGALVLAIVGVLDDKYNLNPFVRLVTNVFAASLPIAAGIGIAFIGNPFGGGMIDLSTIRVSFTLLGETRSIWVLADIFALFWIVAMMNMINMGAKGIPGQMPGVVAIAATTIAVLSIKFSADITQWPVIILAAITAGTYLGFLPWNFNPQKIMPGYSGSTLAGYLLAILAILSTAKVGILMVTLGVPLIDTAYTVARRILSGKSPVLGDRGHLHHRLLDAGLSQKSVTIVYWVFTALLGILALNLNSTYKFYTMFGVALFVGGLILWLTYLIKKRQKAI